MSFWCSSKHALPPKAYIDVIMVCLISYCLPVFDLNIFISLELNFVLLPFEPILKSLFQVITRQVYKKNISPLFLILFKIEIKNFNQGFYGGSWLDIHFARI